MSRISGNTSKNSRIIIIDESDWTVESNTTHSTGSFNVDNLSLNNKTIISRASDGKCLGYGNVAPVSSLPTPFTHDFNTGSVPDPEYWTVGNLSGIVSLTGGKLRLYVGNAGARVTREAAVYFDQYTISGDFQTDIDSNVYASDERSLGSGWNAWNYQFRVVIDSNHWFGFKSHWTWRSDHGGNYYGFKLGTMANYNIGAGEVETPYPAYLSPEVHPAATLRIERSGGLFTLKYKIGSTWYNAVSNINVGSGDIAHIMVYAYDYNHEITWAKLVVDFDNFKINYGFIN